MQSIFNKHVVFLLCFIINVMHLYECATQINVNAKNTLPLSATDAAIADDSAPVTETVIPSATLTSRQLRKMVAGTYRSSYVGGSKLNRRLSSSISQQQHHVTNTNRQLDDSGSSNESIQTETKTKKKQLAPAADEFGDEIKYNVGPGVNVGIEKNRGLVSLYLDEDCLKDVLTGMWKSLQLTHTCAIMNYNFYKCVFFSFLLLWLLWKRSWSEARFNHENFTALHFAVFNSIGCRAVPGVHTQTVADQIDCCR